MPSLGVATSMNGEDLDWMELSRKQRKAWEALGWRQDSWDGQSAAPWQAFWADLLPAQQKAATALGYNEKKWNADASFKTQAPSAQPPETPTPAAHASVGAATTANGEDLEWTALSRRQRHAWEALGWSQPSWDGKAPQPWQAFWADLLPAQKKAAKVLGYTEQDWNADATYKTSAPTTRPGTPEAGGAPTADPSASPSVRPSAASSFAPSHPPSVAPTTHEHLLGFIPVDEDNEWGSVQQSAASPTASPTAAVDTEYSKSDLIIHTLPHLKRAVKRQRTFVKHDIPKKRRLVDKIEKVMKAHGHDDRRLKHDGHRLEGAIKQAKNRWKADLPRMRELSAEIKNMITLKNKDIATLSEKIDETHKLKAKLSVHIDKGNHHAANPAAPPHAP